MKSSKALLVLVLGIVLGAAGAPAVSQAGPIVYNKPNLYVNVDGQDVYVLNPDGTERKIPLASAMSSAHGPVWSRDGRQIAATGLLTGFLPGNRIGGGGYAIVVYDGAGWRGVAPLGTVFPDGVHQAFSPDGKKLVYAVTDTYFAEFYLVNVADGRITALGWTSILDSPLGPSGYGIDWHPNPAVNVLAVPRTVNEWIPFGSTPFPADVTKLYLIQPIPGGGHAVALTNPPLQPQWLVTDLLPAFSPNGKQVAFVRTIKDVWTGTRTSAIRVINTDGTNDRLVHDFKAGVFMTSLSWSPDGKKLVFDPSPWILDIPTTGGYGLYTINLDGTGLQQLRRPIASAPSWSWAQSDLVVTAGQSDLVVTTVTNPPGRAARGSRFSVMDTVRNQGGAASEASVTRYYLSLDTVRNSRDILLIGSRTVPSLAPGTRSTRSVTVTIPSTIASGTYFLLACADDMAGVTESSETNNCLPSAAAMRVD